MIKESKAFTLAEVMMVLVILGVVAAITIPSTIQNIQKSQIETRLKMIYSIMSNAVQMSEAYNGHVNTWVYSDSNVLCDSKDKNGNPIQITCGLNSKQPKAFAQRYITPYLNIMYECKTDGTNKCFANSKDTWADSVGNIIGDNGYGRSRAYAFRLKNGMSIAINILNNEGTEGNLSNAAKVTVDIDGPDKGKSIMGRDVFVFAIGARPNWDTKQRQEFLPGCPRWGVIHDKFPCYPPNGATDYGYGAAALGHVYGGNCSIDIVNNNFKLPYKLSNIANKIK